MQNLLMIQSTVYDTENMAISIVDSMAWLMGIQLILPILLYIRKFLYNIGKILSPLKTSRHFSKVGPARPPSIGCIEGRILGCLSKLSKYKQGVQRRLLWLEKGSFPLGVQGQARMGTGTERKILEWESVEVRIGVARGGARICILT